MKLGVGIGDQQGLFEDNNLSARPDTGSKAETWPPVTTKIATSSTTAASPVASGDLTLPSKLRRHGLKVASALRSLTNSCECP